MNFKNICVIGLGYIGLPTASTFASRGINVTGVDNNAEVVTSLQNGKVHIYEPGLGELVKNVLQNGKLRISNQPVEADAFIIAVPTPFYNNKKADLRFVKSAAESIVPVLRKGNLVVLESTSPPLTTRDVVRPILEKSGLKAGEDFLLAYSPERVLPGQILKELVGNARVIGGINSTSGQAGRELYSIFVEGEIIVTDCTTSEMVKLMENTYRDVNIAIANEFSRLAERFGVDVWEAVAIANRHPRVKILNPGPGVGGHCISVDPWFLVESAPDITPLILTARQVNDSQPHFVVSILEHLLGNLKGKKIAALGLSYKPDVDDLRESPAVEVVHLLSLEGAVVTAFEPYKMNFKIDGVTTATTLEETVQAADVILVLVAHSQFKQLVPQEVERITPARFILDTVNIWQHDLWKSSGFTIARLGDRKNRS